MENSAMDKSEALSAGDGVADVGQGQGVRCRGRGMRLAPT